jgi:hypothetical protein
MRTSTRTEWQISRELFKQIKKGRTVTLENVGILPTTLVGQAVDVYHRGNLSDVLAVIIIDLRKLPPKEQSSECVNIFADVKVKIT